VAAKQSRFQPAKDDEMTAPFDSEIEKLRAEIGGLRIVLAVALNLLPPAKVAERLKLMEDAARRDNLDSATITVLNDFAKTFAAD